MRVLLLLHYPGYVRYFDSVVTELLARGHSVHVAFNGNWKQPEGLAGLPHGHPNLTVDPVDFPVRRDEFHQYARHFRGTTDYVRYLDRRFRRTPWLRSRTESSLPKHRKNLAGLPWLPSSVVKVIRRFMVRHERLKIPSARVVEEYFEKVDPDLFIVSPLVNVKSWQTDAVKSAMKLGIPTALCVASWDHLTTKGLIRVRPDKVFVWNPIQQREARRLHDIRRSDIVVTGAQPFDKWFDRKPSLSREAFMRRAGFADTEPYVLFVGSTSSISEPAQEIDFVRRWIAELRRSGGRLRDINVLVRPHPFNTEHWKDAVIDDARTVVYPRGGANPVDEGDRSDYFHSIAFSDAVMGINTSAMVEATILGRPVLSVLDSSFEDTQEGTLHFQYLLPENGGFLKVARSLPQHVEQLDRVMGDPAFYRRRVDAFVDKFVRPLGREVKATPLLVDELERLGRRRPRPGPAPAAPQATRRGAVSAPTD